MPESYKYVVCICLSPGFQRSVFIDTLFPGEVNRLNDVFLDAAGKGVNVCRVLQRLGVSAFCLAQGGSDAGELMSLAALEHLDLRLAPSTGRLRTCVSIVEMSPATGPRVTELVEPSQPVDGSCADTIISALQRALPTAAAVVIAGSMAPGFPPGYQARLARLAREHGVPVYLDLQGTGLIDAVAERPAAVKINLAEFAATFMTGRFGVAEHVGMLAAPVLSDEIMDAVADISRLHATSFVLTRGDKSILLARQGEMRLVPVPPMTEGETVNTIGCGDAFLAGMLAKLMVAGGPSARSTNPTASISLDALEAAMNLAVACAQSNARTARPGLLETGFAPDPRS